MSTVENPALTGPGAAATHAVTNQSEPLADYNVFTADRPLVEAVSREGGDFAIDTIRAVGDLAGRAETIDLGRVANENPPKLRTHDRFGNRIDEVEFHPAWHELMSMHVSHGLHALPWRAARARRPRRPRRRVHVPLAGRGGHRLPDLDDLLGDPGAAPPARGRRRAGSRASPRSTTTGGWSRRPTRPARSAGWR